jgi:hypothetical protein
MSVRNRIRLSNDLSTCNNVVLGSAFSIRNYVRLGGKISLS